MKPEPEESDVIEEQSFDQSELKKLTEEPLRTKKVRRREKGSGRERACKYSSIVFDVARDLFWQLVEWFRD